MSTNSGKKYSKPCHCHKCQDGLRYKDRYARMVLCPKCGNKRCPKASNHELECSDSNEPGQVGSVYSLLPKEEPEEQEK